MLKKVLTNTVFQILGKAVTATTTLILTIIIGRSLGPTGYGEFTKIFVFVGYFYTLYDFGLNNIFIKLSSGKNLANYLNQPKSHQESLEKHLFRLLLGLRIVISIAFAALAIGIAYALPYDQSLSTGFSGQVKIGITLASLTIVTQALITTANALYQKKLRYDLSLIANAAGAIGVLISSVLIFITSGTLLGYTAAYTVGGLVCATVALILIFKKLKISAFPIFNKAQSQKLLVTSWPIGLALILNLIYFRIDVLILSYSRSSAEVGFYGLAYQFFEAFLTIPIFISNALYPPLAQLFEKNKAEFKKETRFYFALMIGASLTLTFVLFISSLALPPIYGIKFAPATAPLQILSLGLPFFFTSALLWHVAIIRGKQKLLPAIYASGAAFNLVANLIFIPTYGYLAAATVTVISEALVVILLLAVMRRPSLSISQSS